MHLGKLDSLEEMVSQDREGLRVVLDKEGALDSRGNVESLVKMVKRVDREKQVKMVNLVFQEQLDSLV